jgi:excisionase family DNA binding protein
MERLLSPQEICNIIGIKQSTLYAWASRGLIPHLKVNGLLRFRESVIMAWLKLKERGINISEVTQILEEIESRRLHG